MQFFMDEAWRGPLAWPLHVGLVISNISQKKLKKHPLFKDSKQLSKQQRDLAFKEIQALMSKGELHTAISSIDSTIIDRYGITKTIVFGICDGMYQLLCQLLSAPLQKNFSLEDVEKLISIWEKKYNEKIRLIVDGKSDFWLSKLLSIEIESIMHGDDQVPEIAIASILSKVSRDQLMKDYAKQWRKYGFEQHKGYGTKKHYEAIASNGICPIHRKLFLKELFPEHQLQPFDFKKKIPHSRDPLQ